MGLFGLGKSGGTPTANGLLKAARKGDLESLTAMLDSGLDVNSRDSGGWTPLEYAAHSGNAELLAMLVQRGADVNTHDKGGSTPLALAIDRGYPELAEILIAAGAQLDGQRQAELAWLTNVPQLPPPAPPAPVPDYARGHSVGMVVVAEKAKVALEVSADQCTVNWGDGAQPERLVAARGKRLAHRYPRPGNYLITLDAAGLTGLRFATSELAAIYLNDCPQLRELVCHWNKLTWLDLGSCPALEELWCDGNQLTALDVSRNSALRMLHCAKNQLSYLDLSNNLRVFRVDCSANRIAILKINPEGALQMVQCNDNQLPSVELNRIFRQLPNFDSAYGTVSSWYAGQTDTPKVIFAAGDNPGFLNSNHNLAAVKKWLVWHRASYRPPTLAGTPGDWVQVYD